MEKLPNRVVIDFNDSVPHHATVKDADSSEKVVNVVELRMDVKADDAHGVVKLVAKEGIPLESVEEELGDGWLKGFGPTPTKTVCYVIESMHVVARVVNAST